MMKLVVAPDKRLETPVEKFDYNLMHPSEIALTMINLMNSHSGLGIAANQVGFDKQIFVMRPVLNKEFGNPLVVINPYIKGISKETELGIEGCLSHPDLFLKIKRPVSCIVEFESLSDNFRDIIKVETKFDDIDARVFLHEYDHLHGIQFIDRVSKLKLKLAESKRRKKNSD